MTVVTLGLELCSKGKTGGQTGVSPGAQLDQPMCLFALLCSSVWCFVYSVLLGVLSVSYAECGQYAGFSSKLVLPNTITVIVANMYPVFSNLFSYFL